MYGKRGHFFVGRWPYQMYVEYQEPDPSRAKHSIPITLFHGGCVTGAMYWSTPDERTGWAHHFVEAGWTVYVADWPGHGRSGFPPDYASMPYERVVEAGISALERTGPTVLLGGSMSGPIVWKVADLAPDRVKAILTWAPGPPGNIQPADDMPQRLHGMASEETPFWYTDDDIAYMRGQFAAGSLFPVEHLEQYHMLHAPESARMRFQRHNVNGSQIRVEHPEVFKQIPVLIVTSENDPGHPRERDQKTADFLGADFAFLPEVGLPGHSHEMMLDRQNEDISAYMLEWLDRKGIR